MQYKNSLIFLFALTLTSALVSKCTDKKLIIYDEPLSIQINNKDTSIMNPSAKLTYILVDNYKDTKLNNDLIERHYCQLLDSVIYYRDFHVYYIKKSDKSNFEYIKTHPKSLLRYSIYKDLLYAYTFSQHKFFQKEKIINGEISINSTEMPCAIP